MSANRCYLCASPLGPAEDGVLTLQPCGHRFDYHCAAVYLAEHHQCPVCYSAADMGPWQVEAWAKMHSADLPWCEATCTLERQLHLAADMRLRESKLLAYLAEHAALPRTETERQMDDLADQSGSASACACLFAMLIILFGILTIVFIATRHFSWLLTATAISCVMFGACLECMSKADRERKKLAEKEKQLC